MGAIVAKRSGVSVAKLADCVAPALLVAQGIGRFGNWWNQELFGKPTDLPWGLEIDPENRPIDNIDSETFHPTFLYEALWCFAAAGVLLLIERRFKGRIRPGGLFALYVLIYSVGRLWIETLRIDPSHEIAGVRLNVFVAGAAILLSAAFFVAGSAAGSAGGGSRRRRSRPWRCRRGAEPGASGCAASLPRVLPTPVRELDLELDAFEGPFDLLLTLLLKEELEPRDIDIAAIVLAFVEHMASRDELDLEACGEFLVLVSALLELKARALFPDEAAELGELEPEEAAEELARRLAEYRRMKEAAAWLVERLGLRAGPLLPARACAAGSADRAATRRAGSARARRCASCAGRSATDRLARAHGAALPAGLAVPRALPVTSQPATPVRLRQLKWRVSRASSRQSRCSHSSSCASPARSH